MPMGGKRPGAGRPKGSQNKATLDKQKSDEEIRQKAAALGVMPATILLDIARFHYQKALVLRRRKPRDEKLKAEVKTELRQEHALAIDAANKAAQFYHSKLASLQSNVNLEGRITLEDLVMQSFQPAANSNAPGLLIDGTVEEKDGTSE